MSHPRPEPVHVSNWRVWALFHTLVGLVVFAWMLHQAGVIP